MKGKLLFLIYIFSFNSSISQVPLSFYLNHGSLKECQYGSDAVYLLSTSGILDKMDYNGNTIWSKSMASQSNKLTLTDQAIYFFTGQILVKLDTAGNFIWWRDLSVPECGIYNMLVGLVINKDRIFIATNEQQFGFPGGMITLDTAGTWINGWCDQTGNISFIQQGYPRFSEGAWFDFIAYGAGSSYATIVGVDSIGNIDNSSNSINLDFGIRNNVLDVFALPDSTYLALNNVETDWTWDPEASKIAFSKFRENGTVVWQRSFNSLTAMLFVHAARTDSLGNVYVIGEKNNDTSITHFALKIDSAGNLIFANEWRGIQSSFSFPDYCRMGFHNGYLYCPFKISTTHSGGFAIDTLLNPPCGVSDTLIPLVADTPAINSSPWYSYTSVGYNMSDTILNILSHTSATLGDLCLILNTKGTGHQTTFKIIPNPAGTDITLSASEAFKNSTITIYDLPGKEIYSVRPLNSGPVTVDCHAFPPGIYFVKLENEKEWALEKLIIRH